MSKTEETYHNEDITFCLDGKDCKRTDCARRPSNIWERGTMHSFAYMEGTRYCPKTEEIKEQQEQKADNRKAPAQLHSGTVGTDSRSLWESHAGTSKGIY